MRFPLSDQRAVAGRSCRVLCLAVTITADRTGGLADAVTVRAAACGGGIDTVVLVLNGIRPRMTHCRQP